MDCFVASAPRNDGVQMRLRLLAARIAPELCENVVPRKRRAQGKPGARCTRGLVRKVIKVTHTSIQVQRRQSGFPRAMVLTVSSALSPVTGLFCHCHLQVNTCKLDASVGASGPHGFAVRLKRRSSSNTTAST